MTSKLGITKFLLPILVIASLSIAINAMTLQVHAASQPATPTTTQKNTCSNKVTFFGIPTWYEYLSLTQDPVTGVCSIDTSNADGKIVLKVSLAIIDILTRVAAMAAVGFVVYGGFLFVISQGDPGKIVSARKTILNAVIGLVIAILASQIVKFVAKLLS